MQQQEIAVKHLGMNGRMISASKSGYRDMFPDNIIVFNANVATKSQGKIWYGDIDLTLSLKALENLSVELGESVFVFHESQYRFENETKTVDEIIGQITTKYYIIPMAGLITMNVNV